MCLSLRQVMSNIYSSQYKIFEVGTWVSKKKKATVILGGLSENRGRVASRKGQISKNTKGCTLLRAHLYTPLLVYSDLSDISSYW